MKRSTINVSTALALGLGSTLALLWLLGGRPTPVAAAPECRPLQAPGGVITVCLSGGCDYAAVQDAVDAAAGDGDVIKVAAGTYAGVSPRVGITQVVYISKTVTVRGGYTTTNWSRSFPITQPTTLDAEGRGRVLYITGHISPTVEGLHITGGNAAGLGGGQSGYDVGGGVYISDATAAIRNTRVFSNVARDGGGLYLYDSPATLSGIAVFSNTAEYNGGGLYLHSSPAVLSRCTISGNAAGGLGMGGGAYLTYSDVSFTDNTVTLNTSGQSGGGVYLYRSDATLSGNSLASNASQYSNGGGLYMHGGSDATLSGNTIAFNTARYEGGGMCLRYDSVVTLTGNTIVSNTSTQRNGGGVNVRVSTVAMTNDVVADNRAKGVGSGIHIEGATVRLLHTTIARNSGGDGGGVYVTDHLWGVNYVSTVELTNTILVSHTVGISVTAGNTVTVNGVLWYGTPITVSRATTATVTVQNQYEGAPAFVNPDGGDYHLGAGSAAIDRGVEAGVSADVDNQPRLRAPDLGADEYWPPGTPKTVWLPLVLKSY